MPIVALAAALGLTVDTVLLVALAEHRNRRVRQGWMVNLALAAWCWHAGATGYFLLEHNTPTDAQSMRWWTMTFMVLGLLGMPCSLMHAVVRLKTTGWFGAPQRRSYEPFLYSPVLLAVPIAMGLQNDPATSFLLQVSPLVLPYLGVTTVISSLAAVVFWRAARTSELPAGGPFLRCLSATLLTMAVALDVILLFVQPLRPEASELWFAWLVLLPLPPAVLFAFFVLRYGFLPLVLERTVVYGGILAALVLLHRILVAPLEGAWRDRIGIEFVWLEVALGAMLILGYQPMRQRVREAIRYLTSTSVRQFRREVRQLAVDLAAQGGHSPDELSAWFVQALQRLTGVAAIQIVVTDTTNNARWEASSEQLCSLTVLDQIHNEWPAGTQVLYADQAPGRKLTETLLRLRVTLLLRTEYEGLHNLWCLRITPGSEGWDEEELNTLVLLGEQWVAEVRHTLVQAARASAERRAWQAEKLSALGLLAGSLAHEIKNPLSSMKTLTALALEESLPGSEQAESLQLVLQEIDRLTRTTRQLLGFVRSDVPSHGFRSTDVKATVTATAQMVQHRAQQQQVELQFDFSDEIVFVPASREALQSVLLNLILNAVEACPAQGKVSVITHRTDVHVIIEVHDTGPGIPPELQDRLFQPLVTTKIDGTGLGLYSAAQTVRDLRGEIAVESRLQCGTIVRVTLPLSAHAEGTSP